MSQPSESQLSGWGRLPQPGREERTIDLERGSAGDAAISRGLGRSYGDASLPPGDQPLALNTTLADRLLAFDEDTGLLHAEAGFSLLEMNRIFLPRGWFTPVTPGTQFVTLGGMVASDVHGKGQHAMGCFGDHVTRLRMRVADGRVLWCSPDEHDDLFYATIGGMGLTGHILEVEFRMRRVASPWLLQKTERIPNLDAYLVALERAATEWPYTVGWIDCLATGPSMGRGILISGRWAEAHEAPTDAPPPKRRSRLPFDFPGWALNSLSIRAFNELNYRSHWQRETRGVVDPETFFYPLDRLHDWNRMYGKRGFTQYQCVLPRGGDAEATKGLLRLLTERGGASFLAVIKDFGRDGCGILSFPRPGITLALDIAVTDETQSLVDALNAHVMAHGGRVYLTKDAFTRRDDFVAMEGERLDRFKAVRDKWDPERRFHSALSQRLFGD